MKLLSIRLSGVLFCMAVIFTVGCADPPEASPTDQATIAVSSTTPTTPSVVAETSVDEGATQESNAAGWVAAPEGTVVVDVALQGGAPFLPRWSNAPLNRLVLPAIYAELARMGADGQYVPVLITTLPSPDNGQVRFVGSGENQQLEVIFQLHPNARWQDGRPVTAADLIFSWNLVMDSAWPGHRFGQVGMAPEVYVASVEAPTSDSVVYRFMSETQAREAAVSGGKLGDPAIYADLVEQIGPVAPVDYLDVGRNVFPSHLLADVPIAEIGTSEFARRPIYAGPYRLVEGGDDGRPVVVEAFADFALGTPAIERVVFGPGYYSTRADAYWLSPPLLEQALAAGAVHVQLTLPAVRSREGEDPAAYDQISGIAWAPRLQWELIDFNLDNPHLADLRVRQAIAHAIDRQALIDTTLAGHGVPMQSYLPNWHPLFASEASLPAYDFNVEQARALLLEAGYDLSQMPATHPERGTLLLQFATMDVAPYSRQTTVALIEEQLAAIGIGLDVTFYEWLEFEGEDCTAIRNGRQFDLAMAGWILSALYPVHWVEQVTASASIPTPENGCPYEKANWPGWRNAEADELIADMVDGRLAVEAPDMYRQAWVEHQQLWTQELPSLPLFNVQRPVVVTANLSGVAPHLITLEDTWNIYEWVLNGVD